MVPNLLSNAMVPAMHGQHNVKSDRTCTILNLQMGRFTGSRNIRGWETLYNVNTSGVSPAQKIR